MKIVVVAPSAIPSRRANTIQVMKMSQALANLGHTVRLIALPAGADAGSKKDAGSEKSRHPAASNSTSVIATPTGISPTLIHHYGLQSTGQHSAESAFGTEVPFGREVPFGSEVPFRIDWLHANPRLRRYDFGWQAVSLARRWKADLLYTRLPQAAALASQMGLPTILEIHDLPRGRAGRRLFRLFLSGAGARRLVSITGALANDLEQDFGVPTRSSFTILAPDGVDLSRYTEAGSVGQLSPAEARQRLEVTGKISWKQSSVTAGYTGHIYAGRGVEKIVAMAARLPEINFLIAGGEPKDVERLTDEVAVLGLDNIWFSGFIPNAELALYQAACDVLLMPYQKQVAASSGGDIARYLSPMKVFEYMASGRVILSSDLPVLREVLNTNNAILLPPDDLEAWISVLKDIASAVNAEGYFRATGFDKAHPPLREHSPAREIYTSLANQARLDAEKYTWEARAARILSGLDNPSPKMESR